MTTSDPIQFERELNIPFDRMIEILPEVTQKALNVGAYIIKENVKQAFMTKVPAATRPIRQQIINGSYYVTKGDSMVDAVRQSKADMIRNTTRVHILGTNEKGSGQFIARFYEGGTKERYSKHIKGATLKKKHYTGRIQAYNFFIPTAEASINEAAQVMGDIFDRNITEALNNG